MAQDKGEVSKKVRQVLARHYIDTRFVRVWCGPKTVRLEGMIKKLPGSVDKIDASTLNAIDGELRRAANVSRIEYRLDGWQREGGEWFQA